MAKLKSERNDELVLELLQKVQREKAELKKLAKPTWLTTCTIGFSDSVSERVNIMVITDPVRLTELYTRLLAKEEHWKTATNELGLEVPPMHQGYSIADWKQDFKTRAMQLGIDKRKKELEKLEARIDLLVTVEQRRELELEAIKELLK